MTDYMSNTHYDQDIIAWAQEQAKLLRSGRFDALDIEHIAEEIEDVGKSEQRELESRMAVLITYLLKWQHQPERRGSSWQRTIKDQRDSIQRRLKKTPSLKNSLNDEDWWQDAWLDARILVEKETGLTDFPAECPWTRNQILNVEFFP
jgi:hypothetical protein